MGTVCSDEEGEEILRQRGQFPALPFTASDCGSPSPRSPGSPASIGSYRNGGSPQAIPWDRFSVDTFKFPNMPTKYPNSNGRVKKKPRQQISDDIAKSPASGKCFPFLALKRSSIQINNNKAIKGPWVFGKTNSNDLEDNVNYIS